VAENRSWQAQMSTSRGDLTLSLDGAAAPQAVASFVSLARQGFFEDTACHRLTVSGIYVLQCGDPTGTGTGGPGYSFGPIENAPDDDEYPPGTLAMARVGGDPTSQGSQFFLVYESSNIPADTSGGYTVFGQVTDGLDVVRSVADGGVADNGVAPASPVTIEKVSVQ
jgi:peptidyl-prolyl cis-trans isomerase B (cyclophilin B)